MIAWFLLAAACKPPVEAPRNFDALNSYIYQHFQDVAEVLDPGTSNLAVWLEDNPDGVEEGFMIKNLRKHFYP